MNIAVMLLHVDCPTLSADCPTPPKLQLLSRDDMLYGHCPGCGLDVRVAIDPIETLPTPVDAPS